MRDRASPGLENKNYLSFYLLVYKLLGNLDCMGASAN